MIDLSRFETINDFIHEYDRWRAETALRNIWARTIGAPITDDEIDAEIAASRRERSHEAAH